MVSTADRFTATVSSQPPRFNRPIGRLLQGSGAIASATMALAADYTRIEQRTKASAIIGASIGVGGIGAAGIGAAPIGGTGIGAGIGTGGIGAGGGGASGFGPETIAAPEIWKLSVD